MCWYVGSAATAAAMTPFVAASWWTSWNPTPGLGAVHTWSKQQGIEFVPMLSGLRFITELDARVPWGAEHIIGFNEPNHAEQGNLLPAEAAVRRRRGPGCWWCCCCMGRWPAGGPGEASGLSSGLLRAAESRWLCGSCVITP